MEHPIIFSAPMVRAILEGRKTVTRRLADYTKWKEGDLLWVRESVWLVRKENLEHHAEPQEVMYVADDEDATYHFSGRRKVPSIHMPRWASRITLELTADVRREKLNIGNLDYRAEGFALLQEMMELWDEIHPDATWRDNPTVSVITFKRIKP